ncbi:hypothetical protein OUO20_12465 [Arthrobacter sp. FX8]|uniref:hypothetical protein n=1 Tax=Arthrobacter sp. FX8 TaxID=2997335 RepID=UPI00227A12EE|nr:hypothetical protein [Arthrobacter sp. FX8]WAJ32004.1 hypothetical protein OUO20_12465 [Arthrobacter sp. FX8]
MGTLPIERLHAWWISITTPAVLLCDNCNQVGETFPAEGGYRYCSPQCAAAGAGLLAAKPASNGLLLERFNSQSPKEFAVMAVSILGVAMFAIFFLR